MFNSSSSVFVKKRSIIRLLLAWGGRFLPHARTSLSRKLQRFIYSTILGRCEGRVVVVTCRSLVAILVCRFSVLALTVASRIRDFFSDGILVRRILITDMAIFEPLCNCCSRNVNKSPSVGGQLYHQIHGLYRVVHRSLIHSPLVPYSSK